MLKPLFSDEICAQCKNCCIFEKQSAWELPTFSAAAVTRLESKQKYIIAEDQGRFRITLPYDKTEKAQPCPFLNSETGCTLPPEEKPFACSIWPLRVMRHPDRTLLLTLYPTCPAIPENKVPALRTLLTNGLRYRIFSEITADPSMILPYHSNYQILEKYKEENYMKQFPQPESVFRYFSELAAIPHGSGNTEGIRQWALQTAERLSLSAYADSVGNVIIHKDATVGYTDHPRVILQGHLDMVCAKLPDCKKDMATEGITLVWDKDYLSADGTTLGGDDGIAIAYAFALLEANNIPHPPLTVIFTVDEETGMEGATGLTSEALDGQYLINLDSEEEGIFTVGCAGGVRTHLKFPVQKTPCTGMELRLTLSGLIGGHSGSEIHKHLLNANTAMLRLLRAGTVPFQLCEWEGGTRDNVIPTECSVTLFCAPDALQVLITEIIKEKEKICTEYPEETGLKLHTETAAASSCAALTAGETSALLSTLAQLPNGVQSMNDTLHMPETSLNLGIFSLQENTMQVDALVRSSSNAQKKALAEAIIAIAEKAGGSAICSGNYPAWEYVENTTLEAVAKKVYTEQYGNEPVIQTIHAGLECGILAAKAPQLQCLSIGPDIPDIHTPRERLPIASVARTWDFLCALLKAI